MSSRKRNVKNANICSLLWLIVLLIYLSHNVSLIILSHDHVCMLNDNFIYLLLCLCWMWFILNLWNCWSLSRFTTFNTIHKFPPTYFNLWNLLSTFIVKLWKKLLKTEVNQREDPWWQEVRICVKIIHIFLLFCSLTVTAALSKPNAENHIWRLTTFTTAELIYS